MTCSIFKLPVFNKWATHLSCLLLAIVFAVGCGQQETIDFKSKETGPDQSDVASTSAGSTTEDDSDTWHSLANTPQNTLWTFIKFGGRDAYEIDGDKLSVEMGYPMAGFVYSGNDFPTNHYRLVLDARKVDGTDFFCCLTFPVKDQFCSLVIGGWGGTVTGISCIDSMDASDNATKSIRKYETGQWYHVQVDVTDDQLVCTIDDEPVVQLALEGIELSVRTEVQPCKPLGLCSFSTSAEWKNIRYKTLK